MANYPQNVSYLFLRGVYIKLKNDLLISKLKNLILSLMALQAEMRGKEKETMGDAIASVRKTMELLK